MNFSRTQQIWLNPSCTWIVIWRSLTQFSFFLSEIQIGHSHRTLFDWLVYCVWCHFQQYFSYIMAVSFVSGGNRNTRRNHRPVASHWQTLSHIAWAGFKLTMLVVIGTDCIGSYKSNYHTIMATTLFDIGPYENMNKKLFPETTNFFEPKQCKNYKIGKTDSGEHQVWCSFDILFPYNSSLLITKLRKMLQLRQFKQQFN